MGLDSLHSVNEGNIMWHFIRVKNSDLKIDYGWMLKIFTMEQVMHYHESTGMKRNSEVINQFIAHDKTKQHFTDQFAAQVKILADIRNWSPVAALARITSDTIQGQLESIQQYGAIYVNYKGGYFSKREAIKEYGKSKKSQFLSFPTGKLLEDDIKVFSWPGSPHYYAKIGATDVVMGGNQKWNTYNRAYDAAIKFIKKN